MLSRRIDVDLRAIRRRDIFANHIAAERQRQPGLRLPPFAEIDHLHESFASIGELAFVNDQARVGFARRARARRSHRRATSTSSHFAEKSCSARNALVIRPGTASVRVRSQLARLILVAVGQACPRGR